MSKKNPGNRGPFPRLADGVDAAEAPNLSAQELAIQSAVEDYNKRLTYRNHADLWRAHAETLVEYEETPGLGLENAKAMATDARAVQREAQRALVKSIATVTRLLDPDALITAVTPVIH